MPRSRASQISLTRRVISSLAARSSSRADASALAELRAIPSLEWSRRFFPDRFARAPSRMHLWLGARIDEMAAAGLGERTGARILVEGPRGGAKSTWLSFLLPLRAAIEGREPYTLLIADSADQAETYLEDIRDELEQNERLAEAYPWAVGAGPKWSTRGITLRNGCRVEALGTGTKIRGRRKGRDRPTLVILDDPENDEHRYSPTKRKKSRNWFRSALLKVGRSHTHYVVAGTVLHRECLVEDIRRTPGWNSRVFRAIEQWPERMDLWREWADIYRQVEDADHADRALAFFEAHREDMLAGASVLWPEEEPLYDLMRMRVEDGERSFAQEKQNTAASPEDNEWPAELLEGDDLWFTDWPEDLAIRVMAVDPSKGKDARRGDYSAIVQLGVRYVGEGVVLYVDADLERRPTGKIAEDTITTALSWQPHAIAHEVNGFQELMELEFERAARAAGRSLDGFPFEPVSNYASKEVRIRRLGRYLSPRRVRFRRRSPGTALLVDQLRDFPNGDHDDGPDALEMAVRLAIQLSHGPQAGEHADLSFG